MYLGLLALLLALAAWLVLTGLRDASRAKAGGGLLLAAATGIFFASLSFWGEMLWFQTLGYGDRFWTAVVAETGFLLAGAVAGGGGVYLATHPIRPRRLRLGAAAAGTAVGAAWGYGSWEPILRFVHRVPAGVTEPILGLDAGFYLFTLPFLDALYALAITIAGLAVGAAVVFTLVRSSQQGGSLIELGGARRGLVLHPASRELGAGTSLAALGRTLALLALVLAAGRLLAIPHLLYSSWGAVSGPGWTDVHIRMPGLVVVAAATLALGLLPAFGWMRAAFGRRATRWGVPPRLEAPAGLALPWAGVVAVWILALGIVPALAQRFWVEPNEISFEAPYIAHNIALTREGFGLTAIEEEVFPATTAFTAQTAAENSKLLEEIRLWDWRALDAVYRQFQEIRLYYEFVDVDIDRYTINGSYRQVMVSAREMEVTNLPEQSQTFVNRHFKYTHGYGLTMAPVAEFTPEGLPRLLIRDLPPVVAAPELAVDRPQIYYGELTDAHVYVNTTEAEFDYPRGDENETIRYPGKGGVELGSLWRRFVYGWMFDGTRFFLSEYPTPESRVMFHRQVRERVARVAPFLTLDADPYVVLADGRLYWIVDAYTQSRYFPYSEPFSSLETIDYEESGRPTRLTSLVSPELDGANYVRNSVKAVVDAFEGTVDLYVYEPDDPLIRVWGRIYPELFKPRAAMPAALAAHTRYGPDLFAVQGLVYAKYHMTDPEVFYNQEDLWVRATEKYYDRVRPVEPYFVMWNPPGSPRDAVEFTSILPFTPKNRQVMIGWLAGLSDGESYGRLLAYKFPKDRRVLGPQQVETKIDQDPILSQQLTLWDQRGSRVIRGNVLALPVGQTLLYVEPIYLQAETAAYPELRLVVLMRGDQLFYGESLEEALTALAGAPVALPGIEGGGVRRGREAAASGSSAAARVGVGEGLAREAAADRPAAEPGTEASARRTRELAREADRAFGRYLRLQSERRFTEAAAELDRLGKILEELAAEGGEPD